MSVFMRELKAEIARLARREIRKSMAPLKRLGAARRRQIADLRRRIVALQKELKNASQVKAQAALPASSDAQSRFWITGKGVRSLRKRLGLTQVKMARLAGVSALTVVHWEASKNKVSLRRKDTIARLQQIRTLNKRTAAAALGAKPAAHKR